MLGFPNIQSLKLGHLILQSVTVWPALLMNPTGWLQEIPENSLGGIQ